MGASFISTCIIRTGVAVIAVEFVARTDFVNAIVRTCAGLSIIARAAIGQYAGHALTGGCIAYDGFTCSQGEFSLAVVV